MVLFGIMQLYLNMNLEKCKVSSLTKAEGNHIGHASCKSAEWIQQECIDDSILDSMNTQGAYKRRKYNIHRGFIANLNDNIITVLDFMVNNT
jgi:hypothetical protein